MIPSRMSPRGRATILPSMSATTYYILHVLSVIFLTAITFNAVANPKPEGRKKALMNSGILSLLVLVGGFGLVAKVYGNTWPHWAFVKIALWIGLSAMAGMAYRQPGKANLWGMLTLAFVTAAVFLVYLKPAF